MDSNEKSKMYVMKKTIIIACLLAGVTSFGDLKKKIQLLPLILY